MEACQCSCISSSNKLKHLASFHEKCLEENEGRCPRCNSFLMSKTAQLTKSFNEGLLSTPSSPAVSEESTPSDSSLDDDCVTHNNPKDSSYYASEEWQQEIDAALNTVYVPQPPQQSSSSFTSNSSTQQQSVLNSQSSNCVQQQDPLQQFLTFTSGSVLFWFFPQSISQATWNGYNACTFIALLNARLFHLNSNILDLRENLSLSQAWISLFLTTITYGNNMHDKVTSGRLFNFTVVDAFPHLK